MSVRACVAATLTLVAGCSMATQARHEARLDAQLQGYRFHQPLEAVWIAALHVLADRGYQLVGNDRVLVGQPPAGALNEVTGGGFETSRTGEHTRVMETMESGGRFQTGFRYRVEGSDAGGGTCRVVFIAIQRVKDSLDEHESRDADMELELVRRLDPADAARVLEATGDR
jgi:hypothetical protein